MIAASSVMTVSSSYSSRRAIDHFPITDSSLQQSSLDDAAVSKTSITAKLIRRASTTDRPRKTLIKHRVHTADIMPAKPVISPEEFETLPSSIQKKYFSNEERLQIAKVAAIEKRQRKQSHRSEAELQDAIPVQSIETPKRRRTLRKSDSVKQRRSSLPLAFDPKNPPSNDKGAWFESLPEKIRRSQFSKQERDAIPVQTNERPHTSSGSKPCFDGFGWDRKKAMSKTNLVPHSPSTSIAISTFSRDTTKSEPALITDTRRYLNDKSNIPTSPNLPALKTSRSTSEQDLRSTRRAFLLHPLPLPPPVLTPSTALLSPDSELLQQERQLGHQPIISIDGTFELDQETPQPTNQQPQWYDEKFDFGFETLSARKQSVSTSTSSVPPRTLSPSISDGASFETSGPMTPVTPVQAIHSFEQSLRAKDEHRQTSLRQSENATNYSHPQHQTSSTSRNTTQRPVHLVDGFYADHASMQPYSITIHYGNNDPLALQSLPVCDDMTGSHGAFAVHDEKSARGMRRVLKAIRGH